MWTHCIGGRNEDLFNQPTNQGRRRMYKQTFKKPHPTPTEFPEAIRGDKKFIESLLEDPSGKPRNLAVQNIHEDRYHNWIAPGDYGLVTRSEWAASFGWLKLVDVVADEKPKKKRDGGAE